MNDPGAVRYFNDFVNVPDQSFPFSESGYSMYGYYQSVQESPNNALGWYTVAGGGMDTAYDYTQVNLGIGVDFGQVTNLRVVMRLKYFGSTSGGSDGVISVLHNAAAGTSYGIKLMGTSGATWVLSDPVAGDLPPAGPVLVSPVYPGYTGDGDSVAYAPGTYYESLWTLVELRYAGGTVDVYIDGVFLQPFITAPGLVDSLFGALKVDPADPQFGFHIDYVYYEFTRASPVIM